MSRRLLDRVEMKKKGFISTAVICVFLVIFLVTISSILSSYMNRLKIINNIKTTVKDKLNEEYNV